MQCSHLSFRAPAALVQAVSAAAQQSGVTASELIRQAVEERVARCESAPDLPPAFDPFSKLSAAARGNLQAQRDLANEAARMSYLRDDKGELVNDPETCLIEGLVFARLAAARGELCDQGLVLALVAMLAEVIGEEACADQMAEALARISLIADNGNEWAGAILPGLAEDASATVMASARDYATRIKDRVFGHEAG